MSKRLLVIDRDDQGRFLLAVHDGILTIGASANEAEIVLRDLHVTRLHCEVEVDENLVVADNPDSGGAPQKLQPGATLHCGLTHLRFQSEELVNATAVVGRAPYDDMSALALDDSDSEPSAPPAPETADENRLRFRFLVVDGADKGRHFALPDSGLVTVGKSHKHADIILNDLYVSRVHCDLRVEADHLMVRHVEGQSGTLVNGQQVKEKELHVGSVLRVGNTHLRLECFAESETQSALLGMPAKENVGGHQEAADDDEAGFTVIEEEGAVDSAETVVESTEAGADSYLLPHSPVDPLLELEGQTFGHFKIDNLLGRGQSGLVFRAQDFKTKQTVSLKVIAADFPASDAELSRFVAAVKTASSLHHSALVTVYAAGKSGPYCWLSREYLEGESLTRRVRRLNEGGKPDWKAACRLALHLATLLDFLHRHKVAHGNITPRNVLVRTCDQMTKLADLMLNRALEGSKLQKAILPNKLLTELPYMAPEQTEPHAPVTPLGDIYSLGVVLYATLTGKPPFTGDTPKAVLSQIHRGKVVPPSKLQRGIPPLMETTVLMMMARRPEERFQSARDVLEALESFAEKHDIKV